MDKWREFYVLGSWIVVISDWWCLGDKIIFLKWDVGCVGLLFFDCCLRCVCEYFKY